MKTRRLLIGGAIVLIAVAVFVFVVVRMRPSPCVRQAASGSSTAREAAPLTWNFAVPVLMYHRICDLTPRDARSPLMCDLTVPPAAFDEQVRYLAENHFAILSVKDVETALLGQRPLPERAVAITMDDGYADNFECALPILRRYSASATIFLVTAAVGSAKHLTWEQVLIMNRRQVGFESHTVHHYDLTTLATGQLMFELGASKQIIEEELGNPVTQVAYPSGMYNDAVIAAARTTGYHAGWKKGGGPVTPGDDPYLLPRVRVHGRTTMEDFKRKVWSGIYAIRQRQGGRGP